MRQIIINVTNDENGTLQSAIINATKVDGSKIIKVKTAETKTARDIEFVDKLKALIINYYE